MDSAQQRRKPLILVFSSRHEMRSILSVGLIHGDFSIIEASTPYIAGVKANQYKPDLVVVDIAHQEVKDFLLLSRLERCVRTRDIPVVISATPEVHKAITKIREETDTIEEDEQRQVSIVEYPFHFSVLIDKINKMLGISFRRAESDETRDDEPPGGSGDMLFQTRISKHEKLAEIEKSVSTQWAFPYTVVRAVHIIESEKSGTQKLAQCIESDVAAASAVLRIANTVYYSKSHGRTSDLKDAIVRIGFDETRKILESLSLIEISQHIYSDYGFARTEFWMHSLATAVIAEKLYRDAGGVRPDIAFMSGLLHDVGKVPLDNNFSRVFPALLEETTNHIVSFHETEKRMMGFDHAELGGFFAQKWNFPEEIVQAVGMHHQHEDLLLLEDSNSLKLLCAAVYTANILAKAMGMGHSCDEVLEEIPPGILEICNIVLGLDASYFEDVYFRLDNFVEYLSIPKSEVGLHRPLPLQKQTRIYVVYGSRINFHPIECGLRNNHYPVTPVKELPSVEGSDPTVVIFIPDKGSPLDFTLRVSDEKESGRQSTLLKVFLLEGLSMDGPKKEYNESNVVLMDRKNLDLRLLLHVVEDFTHAVTMGQMQEQELR